MLGGFAGVHQFCRIGAHAMIAAGSIVLQDVPPFVTAAGLSGETARDQQRRPQAARLRRRSITAIRRAYKTLYRNKLPLDEARAAIAAEAARTPVLQSLAEFLETPGRGIIR